MDFSGSQACFVQKKRRMCLNTCASTAQGGEICTAQLSTRTTFENQCCLVAKLPGTPVKTVTRKNKPASFSSVQRGRPTTRVLSCTLAAGPTPHSIVSKSMSQRTCEATVALIVPLMEEGQPSSLFFAFTVARVGRGRAGRSSEHAGDTACADCTAERSDTGPAFAALGAPRTLRTLDRMGLLHTNAGACANVQGCEVRRPYPRDTIGLEVGRFRKVLHDVKRLIRTHVLDLTDTDWRSSVDHKKCARPSVPNI